MTRTASGMFGIVTTGGTVYADLLITEYWLNKISYPVLIQVFSFAQLVRHVITSSTVLVRIIEYRGRVYGPLPPGSELTEPTLLDTLVENAPLIAIAALSIIAACLFLMKKRGVSGRAMKLSGIRQRFTKLRKRNESR